MDDENNSKNQYLEIFKNKNFWTKPEIVLGLVSLIIAIISIPWWPSWLNSFISEGNENEQKLSVSVVDEKLEVAENDSNNEKSVIWYENGNSIDGLKDCNYELSDNNSKVSDLYVSHNDSLSIELDFKNENNKMAGIAVCSSKEVVDPKNKRFLVLSISGGDNNSKNISVQFLEYTGPHLVSRTLFKTITREWTPVVRHYSKRDFLDPYIYPDIQFKNNKWYTIKIPLEKLKLPENNIYGVALIASYSTKLYINKIAFE